MSSLFCPTCACQTLHEMRDDLGDTVCTQCGNVLEENKIVAQVEFVETAGGSSAVLGQYVSATSSRPFGSGLGLSRESRELAVENARKALNQMGSLLQTPPHFVEVRARRPRVAASAAGEGRAVAPSLRRTLAAAAATTTPPPPLPHSPAPARPRTGSTSWR